MNSTSQQYLKLLGPLLEQGLPTESLGTTVALNATALNRQALDVTAWALKQILPLPTTKPLLAR